MITLYTEDDLIQFGNYMLSKTRKESIKNHPEIKDNETRKKLLANVTTYDLAMWHKLMSEIEKERFESEHAEKISSSSTPQENTQDTPMSQKDLNIKK